MGFPPMRTGKRLLTALALSFSIYALPIVTPHWIDLFGYALGHELLGDREAAWKATDLALGAIVQAVMFAGMWVMVPRSILAAGTVNLLLLIPATLALNFAYLNAIPSRFLIEADTAPDASVWPEACVVDGFSLDAVPQGVSRGMERRGEAWLRRDSGTQYGILQVPGCTVEPVAIPELPITPTLQQGLPDGSVMYVTMERGAAKQQYWLLRRGAKEPRRIEPSDGHTEGVPLVADDGEWVAWLVRSPDREASLRIEPLGRGEPIVFSHALLQRTTALAVELDMTSREVIVNRDLSAFARLRLDGTVAWGPLTPGPIAAQSDTLRYLDGQWAAWDAYVEKVRYRLGWSTRDGAGQYQAPKGRSITSAALDAQGRYVAASTTTALNLGAIKDTVVVLRTRDGSTVFRKTLRTYTRSQVAFLGDRYFAYSDAEGTLGRTHVLRITE